MAEEFIWIWTEHPLEDWVHVDQKDIRFLWESERCTFCYQTHTSYVCARLLKV